MALIINRWSFGKWCCSMQSTRFITLNILFVVILLHFVLRGTGDENDNLILTNYTHQFHRHLKFKPREYTYIIIHYHKTGYHLSRSIVDMISGGIQGVNKPTVWSRRAMLSTFSKNSKVWTHICLCNKISYFPRLHDRHFHRASFNLIVSTPQIPRGHLRFNSTKLLLWYKNLG